MRENRYKVTVQIDGCFFIRIIYATSVHSVKQKAIKHYGARCNESNVKVVEIKKMTDRL